ncbi:Rab-GAP TBC domain-containing protein [Entamoeba marina]
MSTTHLKEFLTLLTQPVVDLKKLSKLSWRGVPSNIRYDVSSSEVNFIQHSTAQDILERVLYLWALRHPASGYVQGLNDLVIPIFVVLLQEYSPLDTMEVFDDVNQIQLKNVEADTYWCLSLLLENVQDHYTSSQHKIFEQLNVMKQLLAKVNTDLYQHFIDKNVEYFQFAFRWFNCFLLREMSLTQGLRLWDTYLSEEDGSGFSVFHLYVCVALIQKYSSHLLSLEFAEIVQFLQNLPSDKWSDSDLDIILSQAYILKRQFLGAPSHLRLTLPSTSSK